MLFLGLRKQRAIWLLEDISNTKIMAQTEPALKEADKKCNWPGYYLIISTIFWKELLITECDFTRQLTHQEISVTETNWNKIWTLLGKVPLDNSKFLNKNKVMAKKQVVLFLFPSFHKISIR